MAFSTGDLTVTVTGGTPAVAAHGATLLDGVYAITVSLDNSGVSLSCSTPYGATGQTGFTKGDDIS